MTDRRTYSPEYIEDYRNWARGQLDPRNQIDEGGYAIGIGRLLQALSGHYHLRQAEDMRQQSLRDVGGANIPPGRQQPTADGPAVSGYTARAQQGGVSPERAEQIRQQAIAADRRSTRRPSRRAAPLLSPSNTTMFPSVNTGEPPVTAGSQPGQVPIIRARPVPLQNPINTVPSRGGGQSSIAPNVVPNAAPGGPSSDWVTSIAREQDRARSHRGGRSAAGFPGDDESAYQRLTGSRPAGPTLFYVRKYGPRIARDINFGDRSQSAMSVFARGYRGPGNARQAFLDSIPPSLSRIDPRKITLEQWDQAWRGRMFSGALGDVPELSGETSESMLAGRQPPPRQQNRPMMLGGPEGQGTPGEVEEQDLEPITGGNEPTSGNPSDDRSIDFMQPPGDPNEIVNQVLGGAFDGNQPQLLTQDRGQQPSTPEETQELLDPSTFQQAGTGGVGLEPEMSGSAPGGASGGVGPMPIPGRQSQQLQQPTRVAQAAGGTMNDAGPPPRQGGMRQPPPELPTRIPVDQSALQRLERLMTSSAFIGMPQDQRAAVQAEYGRLLSDLRQPIEKDFGNMVGYYDPTTGQLVNWAPKPYSTQVGGETFTTNTQPGGGVSVPNFIRPGQQQQPSRQAPSNQPQSSTGQGAGGPQSPVGGQAPSSPTTRSGRLPPHPITGDLSPDLEEYRSTVRHQGEADSRRLANEDASINNALEAYDQSVPLRADLDFIRTLTNRSGPFEQGGMYRGPGADWVQQALRIMKNFGVEIPATDVVMDAEGIKKVIVQLGSQATRQLSNRPANFEFQTILNAFPGLEVSFEGANMLLDYLEQVQHRIQETGQAAEEYSMRPIEQRTGWRRIVSDLDRRNPIMINIPAGRWLRDNYRINTPIQLTTRRITEQEERSLPNNIYFLRNGNLYRGEGPAR